MKVLFVGHGGCYNRGCDAIIRSTLLMLKQEFVDLEVVLASFDPENDALVDFGFPVKVIAGRSSKLWQRWTWDWVLAMFLYRLPGDRVWDLIFSPILSDLKSADVVISIGGDNYTEDYTYDSLSMYLLLNRFVKQHHKKLVIWGASIGPFTDSEKLPMVIKGLNLADLITVREAKSFEYLKQIGIKNIKRVADPAFLLPVRSFDLPIVIKNDTGRKLGFNISPLLRDYFKDRADDIFIKESVKFLAEIIREKNLSVILIPHVIQKGSRQTDDYSYMKDIYDALRDTGRVCLLEPNYSSEELKYVISLCDFFIGARTHSTIAALSLGVPTVSIGYSRKSVGINEDLLGSLKYLLDMKDFNSVELMKKFIVMHDDKDQIKKRLADRLPEIKKMSLDNVKYLKGLVGN